MLELKAIDVTDGLLIAGVLVASALLSMRFNAWIDVQTETDPDGGYSAVFTVIGVTYTLLAALAILTILIGWWQALFAIVVVFACFAVAGVPMIIGDMLRAGRRRRENAEVAARAEAFLNEDMEV